jgi:predicted GH43/DUF377 family glycosyl hydrolase
VSHNETNIILNFKTVFNYSTLQETVVFYNAGVVVVNVEDVALAPRKERKKKTFQDHDGVTSSGFVLNARLQRRQHSNGTGWLQFCGGSVVPWGQC